MSIVLKKKLYDFCQEFVQEKIDRAQQAIQEIQELANQETKSSAGDKYETGRAMMHLEKDKHSRQLAEALKLKQTLHLVTPDTSSQKIVLGSIVFTSIGNFYIAISAGKYVAENEALHCISLASPIGQALHGQIQDNQILFRNQSINIISVF